MRPGVQKPGRSLHAHQRLDFHADFQDAFVFHSRSRNHETDRCRTGRMAGYRKSATIEEINQIGISQHKAIRVEISLFAFFEGPISGAVSGTDGIRRAS